VSAAKNDKILVIACGAIARELAVIRKLNQWNHIDVQCLPSQLHNRPERLAAAVRAMIEDQREHYSSLFVAYADCGTGGALDKVLDEYGISRLPGAHCYEFLAGSQHFKAIAESDPATFYLTDFLVRHFERLVIQGLGIDRMPQLLPVYFRNYKRVVYLGQSDLPELVAQAESHAGFLGLDFEYHETGYTPFNHALSQHLAMHPSIHS
jgi:hypothetical protein